MNNRHKLSDDQDNELAGQIHQDNEELGQQAQAKWSNDEDADLLGQIYQLVTNLDNRYRVNCQMIKTMN
jgi:hypothetical protein